MKAAVLYKPYDLKVEDLDEPEIGPHEVLIEVKATGVCGTDILTYKGLGPYVSLPVIPGHEFSGEVAKIGAKVSGIQLGARMVFEGSWGCGDCYLCRTGRSMLCEKATHVGRDSNGSFAQYVKIPAKQLLELPQNVSFEDAQSVTTIASAVRAVKLSEISIGDNVAILGPGHAGLIISQVAKLAGASRVIVTGTRDNRLRLASELGAEFTVNVRREDVIKAIKDLTEDLGVDVVIEATGSPLAVKQAIDIVTPGGTIVIFGVAGKAVDQFEVVKVYAKEIRILGSHGGLGEYDRALKLLSLNKVRVRPLITHELPLEETERALKIADGRIDDAIRVLVKP